MWRLSHISAGLMTVLLALGRGAGQEKPSLPPFTPAEVIIKFSPKSKAAELVARASAEGNLSDAQMISYIDSLARKVGVPLQIKQFGSGGNVILAIRQSDVTNTLLKRLQANPKVKAARVVPAKGLASSAIEADFAPGSPEEQIVAHVVATGRDTGSELRTITEQLGRESGVALTGRVTSSQQLLLTIDFSTLASDLAKRLAECPDVEYVQPNSMRRPMGAVN